MLFYFSFKNLKGSARTVFVKDQITFICPNTVIQEEKIPIELNKDSLYANIYMVDQKGYDNCNATGGFKIMICNNPLNVLSGKVTILTTQPSISIPEFTAGQLHYFIGKRYNLRIHLGLVYTLCSLDPSQSSFLLGSMYPSQEGQEVQ